MLKGEKPLDMETIGYYLYMQEQEEKEKMHTTKYRSWNTEDFGSESEPHNREDKN